jgi:hypothetical protein
MSSSSVLRQVSWQPLCNTLRVPYFLCGICDPPTRGSHFYQPFMNTHQKTIARVLACVSLLLIFVGLLSVSWIHHKHIGIAGLEAILPIPATTGRADADELKRALKTEYHLVEPAVPLYLSGKGLIIPLSELQPSLRFLRKDFELAGGPYVYCNLPSQVWKGLKKESSTQKYPLLWSSQRDATGSRLVISVNLKTDIFNDELVSEETFTRMISELELGIRKQSEDANFHLSK